MDQLELGAEEKVIEFFVVEETEGEDGLCVV